MKRTTRSRASFLGGAIIVLTVLLISSAAWTTEDDYMDVYTGADADMVGSEVCLACHSDMADAEGNHLAVLADDENGCEGCHGPGSAHNGDAKGILVPSKMPQAECTELCSACHDEEGKYEQAVWEECAHHEAGMTCTDCHLGHSDNVMFLTEETEIEQCGKCHEDYVEQLEAGEHGNTEMSCNQCHNPHDT